MTYNARGPGALDYLPCRYGRSRLLFRGPKRSLEGPFYAFIGGTETYGKFVEDPFPALVEADTGETCVNFGQMNAGIDAFARDPFIFEAAEKADVTVVQVLGAHNMTNRFYTVHPRRNDRFVSATTLLQTIYRETDFADFHFTKHMLTHLKSVCPVRFETLQKELQAAWIARMRLLLNQITGKTILLWLADHQPMREGAPPPHNNTVLGPDPLFVTADMIDEIAGYATEYVEIVISDAAQREPPEGQFFGELEVVVASETLGPKAHAEAAAVVQAALKRML